MMPVLFIHFHFIFHFQGELLPPADEGTFRNTAETLRNSTLVLAYVAPRGAGPTAWDQTERKKTQHQRRFYLLGQTLDGMRVWDLRRAIQVLRSLPPVGQTPLTLQSRHTAAGVAPYASLFEPDVRRLELYDFPCSQREGPYMLNVQRYIEMPQAVAMAAEKTDVVIHQADATGWEYPAAMSNN